MKKRFTEEQIIVGLWKVGGGMTVKELSREMGISEPIYYQWKRKFSGMEVSDLRRLRTLEDVRLKRLVANQAVGIAMTKEISSRKW
jgi:putative transposase